jgi:alkanesulfonate monooxygenase SsuD/methylene tetrahydromethanopterin reductase-like flavin-dependent oxidoreductase (luciferase family)
LRNKTPQSFAGKYFKLVDALFYPHTELAANIPLLVGGNGPRRILPLAARFADEWNAIYRTPTQFSKLNKQLDRLLENQGRSKDEVKRSQMMGLIYSIDQQDLIRKLNGKTVDAYWQGGVATGCTEQIIDQITELEAVGVEQIVFQWPDVDDLDLLEHFAKHILPEVSDSV